MMARGSLHWCIALVAAGCSDLPSGSPNREPPQPPPLEAVPFAQLRSGTFMFQRISVGAEQAVYVIDAGEGRSWTSSIGTTELVLHPSVAPDGRRGVFRRWSDDHIAAYDIYVANLDGTNEQRVASFDGNSEGPPSWTPDGSQITFVVNDGHDVRLYRQSPTASASDRMLVRTFTVPSATPVCPLPLVWMSDAWISISPVGNIAFNCMSEEIDVIDAEARPIAAYTAPAPSADLAWVHGPAWSPDGEKLAFLTEVRDESREFAGTSVVVVAHPGGEPAIVATVPSDGMATWDRERHFSLCWLPDGSGILFTAPDGQDATHLFVVSADGGAVTRVTSAPSAFDRSVSCSRYRHG